MEKVLVTGGLGFIGRALSEKLRDQGYDVRILDNRLRGDEKYLDGGTDAFDIHIGDIRDPSVVESAVKGCDKVFHLAAINGTKNFYNIPRQVFEVGVVGTHLLLDAAIKEEIGEFLFMRRVSKPSRARKSSPSTKTMYFPFATWSPDRRASFKPPFLACRTSCDFGSPETNASIKVVVSSSDDASSTRMISNS